MKSKLEKWGWKQRRPDWCPKANCIFKRRAMDSICGGFLPEAIEHAGDFNTFCFCINDDETPDVPVLPLMVNKSDLDWFRWIFDALDGKRTSWLSMTKEEKLNETT